MKSAYRVPMLPRGPAQTATPGSLPMRTTTVVTLSRRGVLGSLLSISLATLAGCSDPSSDTARSAFSGVNVARADEARADVHGAG